MQHFHLHSQKPKIIYTSENLYILPHRFLHCSQLPSTSPSLPGGFLAFVQASGHFSCHGPGTSSPGLQRSLCKHASVKSVPLRRAPATLLPVDKVLEPHSSGHAGTFAIWLGLSAVPPLASAPGDSLLLFSPSLPPSVPSLSFLMPPAVPYPLPCEAVACWTSSVLLVKAASVQGAGFQMATVLGLHLLFPWIPPKRKTLP